MPKVSKLLIDHGVINPRYTVNLDGKSYEIELKYNTRICNKGSDKDERSADEFLMTLKLSGNNNFIASTPLRVNRPLLIRSRYKEDCPKGELFVVDASSLREKASSSTSEGADQQRVSLEGLGKRFELWYVTD